MKIYLNGKMVEKEEARVSVFDHGFLYGDGAFEGIRAYSGVVFRLKEHIDRLYETCHTMMINTGLTKKQMIEAVVKTLKANGLTDGYIRLVVTRGDGDLGLDPRKCKGNPNIIIIADKITLYPEEFYKNGLAIVTVPTVRNHIEAINPQLKSLNYLNNIMAKIEANNAGVPEAIMLDGNGYVAECTGDNIFMVKGGVLKTPQQGRLRGITRDTVMELAATKCKIKVEETFITRHEFFNADECFLTGTAAELIPVIKIDGRIIGTGKPGPVTAKLLKLFHDVTRKDGVKYSL
ncbi:MAG: branched-chain-amino-acid transaminase [Candidatus Omnitrophica bacterium]|nr:branched-chain-amino-acid transaminase [Candidatus Omnitrophota bacterium]